MDLGAYVQIEELEKIMVDNNIDVPRLRGLRLMKDEDPCSQEDIDAAVKFEWLWLCHYFLEDRYIIYSRDEEGFKERTGINWRTIHGKKRKNCRFELKKAKRKVINFFEIRNKYCGREDVLRIHARIGGKNWKWFDGPELEKQPWFIEKADDYFDSTYCDIYARIENACSEFGKMPEMIEEC